MTKTKEVETENIEEISLDSLDNYLRYNKLAAKLNKENKKRNPRSKGAIYPYKSCPSELHPKKKIIFNRKDQPRNPLYIRLENHMIDFEQTLMPGQTYELPEYIIDYLAEKGTPVYEQHPKSDGTYETKVVGKEPRFAIRSVYQG